MEEELVVTEEQQPGKKKIKGLPSTIVSGVFIVISLICLALAYALNIGNIIKDMTEGKTGGDAVGAVFGAIIVIALVVLIILALLVLPASLSIPTLILSIKNIKRDVKPIKIIGIVFTAVSALIMVGVVLRVIFLFANIL
jgi:hypothetical protein